MGSKKHLGRILSLVLLIFFLFSTDLLAGDKIKVRDIGLIRYFELDNSASIMSADHDHSVTGLALNQINYRVSTDAPASLGYCIGTGLQMVFPPKFDFSPMEGVVQLPSISADIVKGGLAFGVNLSDDLRLVSHAGLVVNAGFGMWIFSDAETHSETLWWGVLPELGTRLFIIDGLNFALSYRFGKLKAQGYAEFEKVGDSYKTDSNALMLTVSLSTDIF